MLLKIFKFVISIALCQSAGLLGSFFTIPAIPTWYATLNKPSFSPPDWLFSPVWISLYTLMGISLFMIWNRAEKGPIRRKALVFFFIQLILNALWSVCFFGLQSPLSGLIEMAFLWSAIVLTIYYFLKLSPRAAILLVPYLVWVSFAFILNFSLWSLNRQ
jgi:tryptophan-rich sensory protein